MLLEYTPYGTGGSGGKKVVKNEARLVRRNRKTKGSLDFILKGKGGTYAVLDIRRRKKNMLRCRRWTENFLGFVKGPDQCWAGTEHVL